MSDEKVTVLAIVACDSAGAIGYRGKLLYQINADMRRFARITQDSVLLMGRKTFESLPKILPGRSHVVVSGRELDSIEWPSEPGGPEHIEVIGSLARALATAKDLAKKEGHNRVSVIGGGAIYDQLLNAIDTFHLTVIEAVAPAADAHFPLRRLLSRVDENELISTTEGVGEQDGLGYQFLTINKVEEPISYAKKLGERGFVLIRDGKDEFRVQSKSVSAYGPDRSTPCIWMQYTHSSWMRTLRYEDLEQRDLALKQMDKAFAGVTA